MKILGIPLGRKTIDEILAPLSTMQAELEEAATFHQDEAVRLRDEAEAKTQEANRASGLAGEARAAASRLRNLVVG